MKRMKFNSNGRLVGVDDNFIEYKDSPEDTDERTDLIRSDSLQFLKENDLGILDSSDWGLYNNGQKLPPLKFSNGKTQEDIVKEVVNLVKKGEKIIFLKGTCGTGKSAIALNIARKLGRTSIVVPIKSLQKQYEQDYLGEKTIVKPSGKVMKIAMITGRENHDSIIIPGASCADPTLPDTIKITEKNYSKIIQYYKENPYVNSNEIPDVEQVKRISIAPANPYWSPILPANFEIPIKDAKKKKYLGLEGKEFIFYHRKEGCSYYDQYLAYLDADVIIFNSAKYKIETAMGRKPLTEIEIFDEADEFLDNLADQVEINLNHLSSALKSLSVDSYEAKETTHDIMDLIELEQKNKRILGVNEDEVYGIEDTKMMKILTLFKNRELESEIAIDELNYANKALEAAKMFEGNKNVYASFRKRDQDLCVTLVTTDLSNKVKELADKNKVLMFMSGTLHSEDVLKHIFGLDKFAVVEAESLNQGSIEIHRTGREFDCRYSNFSSDGFKREDYLSALSACLEKAKKPVLVQVNAFEDLPRENEMNEFDLSHLVSKEDLIYMQNNDRKGERISFFKQGKTDVLFTTKCSRGVDFPGNVCNSIVFTKYPNPNMRDNFWKVLKKTHPSHFWEFYKDKARREFLQRIYRAVRSKNDHVFVLSPDMRVIDAVKELQRNGK
jgi:Rad3-related DNA helicase